ncbi:MAG TPA: hypothetical protein VIB79_16305 [Candidatus Binatia bacterium]|jgi:hypothetical protein
MDYSLPRRMQRFLLFLVALANCSTALAWEEPDGFLGLRWGSPTAEFRDQQPRAQEMTTDALNPKGRTRSFAVANAGIQTVSVNINYVFLDDQFVCAYVFFAPKEFFAIESIFASQYGPPHETKQNVLSPQIGVEYQNKTLKWEGETIIIEVSRYYGARPDGFAAVGKKSFLHPPPRPIFLRPQ